MATKQPLVNSAGQSGALSPWDNQQGLVATDRSADTTHRLETDASGNLYVNVASGSLSAASPEPDLLIHSNTAATNTAAAVKASAARLHNYHVYNPNASVVFVQLFNVASGSVTVGTTTPTLVLAIPPAGVLDGSWATSKRFTTACSYAVTTTATGSTAAGSNCNVNFDYI